MFVAHPTVRLKGSEHVWQPVICSDKNCENRDRKNHMHCPLCQSASCSTDLAYMKMHFRVKHVDEGLDCKTGFYSLKCYRHCKIINWRKEKLLKTPHWHCFKCRNAFIRKDDLIVHYQSHRVHKNNGKVMHTTHVVVQKDINQGMLVERNRKGYQTLAKIHPCSAKVLECRQPQNDDGHIPIFPKSYIMHAITQPTATEGEVKVTNQLPTIINNNVEYSFIEEQITEDVEIQIVDTRSPDVVRHSEAVATIIDSDFPLDPEKNHIVLQKKERRTALPKDSNVTSQKEPCIPSQNDVPVPRKRDLRKTSHYLLSENSMSQTRSPNDQSLISVSDQSSAQRGSSLSTRVDKSQPPSKDTQQPSANDKCSSPLVNQCSTACNGQIWSSQNDRSTLSQKDEHQSSNNDHGLSPRTDQCLPSEKESCLPSRKGQCIPPKEKESLPSQRDDLSLSNGHCTDGLDQSPRKDRCPSLDKNMYQSHEDCINQKMILLEEKKQLERGLEVAKKEKSEMADTIRGMKDAICQLREENKEMGQKLSKLAEENAALRRQLNVITSAIFSPESSKSSPSSKNSSASKGKSKSPAVNKTILVTPHHSNSASKGMPRMGSLHVVSRPIVRMKSILLPVRAEEEDVHQALIGPELQASLGQKVTKVVNPTGDTSQGREDTNKPSRPQNVLNVEQNHAKDKTSETNAKSYPSRSESGISSSGVQLDSSSKSLHDILEETFNVTPEHLESQDIEQMETDTTKSTGVSEQNRDTLLSGGLEAELQTQNVGLSSFEMEEELLSSSSGFSSPVNGTATSSTDDSMELLGCVSENVVSQNDREVSNVEQNESMFYQREDSSSPEFIESTESLLEMFEASLNGEHNLSGIGQFTSPPATDASEGDTDGVTSSLLSSILIPTSDNKNDDGGRENVSQELVRFGDNSLTTNEQSLVSPGFEVSPQKDFETSFFGSNENLSKQRSLSDVLSLDENFDLSQVSDEFRILDRCFDSDLGEKNSSGYSVCSLSALLDDDNFLLNTVREDELERGRKRYLDTDEIGRPKKRK